MGMDPSRRLQNSDSSDGLLWSISCGVQIEYDEVWNWKGGCIENERSMKEGYQMPILIISKSFLENEK